MKRLVKNTDNAHWDFTVSTTGKLIKELRIKAGLTWNNLAEALHITDKAVSKWERDLALPDMALLPKLSLLLDTDVEILLH